MSQHLALYTGDITETGYGGLLVLIIFNESHILLESILSVDVGNEKKNQKHANELLF